MGIGKETRKILLYRLSRLVKALYPNTRTSDPYPEYQETIFGHLDAEEQLLYRMFLIKEAHFSIKR
jgi:hypothetical protein